MHLLFNWFGLDAAAAAAAVKLVSLVFVNYLCQMMFKII